MNDLRFWRGLALSLLLAAPLCWAIWCVVRWVYGRYL